MNKLPLKLEKLRKHYNYSQSYLAEVLNVDVVDYMGYENGRTMINYAQMKKLASLYHINIVEIFRNDDNVTLYDVANADTDQVNIEYFIPKKTILTRAKERPLLSGAIVGLLIIAIVGSLLGIKSKNRPYVSYADNTDRLAVSESSLVYIDNLGAVKGSGDNDNGQISNLPSEHAIKVAEGYNFTVILLEDGTVTSTGLIENYQKEIKKWKNIIDIACGDNHIVAVDNNGEVYSVGDNSYDQCNLDGFDNIKNIYCAPLGTIGVNDDGNICYTGQILGTSTLKKHSNVIDIDANKDNMILLNEDGTCDYVASFDNTIYSHVLSWKDVVDVTCGNDFFAALKSDGTVEVASLTLNEDEVHSWSNIIAIDSGNDYLIGFDGKTIKGVGKNTYHQFETKEITLQTLPKVKNLFVDYNNDIVKVTFDEVNNATGYEVLLSIDDNTKIKKTIKPNEKVSFDTSDLKDNNYYEVSIIALGDNKVYGNSLPTTSGFTFMLEVEEVIEEKITLRSDLIGQSKNDFEAYLNNLGVNSFVSNVDENTKCEYGYETVVEINGIKPGETYSKQELNARNISYTYCKLELENIGDISDEGTDLEN